MKAKPVKPRAGQIMIARHGRPALDRSRKITWRDYEEWWRAYDAGGLAANQTPPEAIRRAAAEADVIFTSSLRRALETAAAVAQGRETIADPIFVEAPLPPPPLPGRLKPGTWGVYARIGWWLGAAGGLERRDSVELRAEAAVATVAARALRGQNVLLVAHGWFNRMMRPVLLRQGWKCVEDGGDGYWAVRRFVRR